MNREDFDIIINFLSYLFLIVVGVLVSFGMFYIILNNIEDSLDERERLQWIQCNFKKKR